MSRQKMVRSDHLMSLLFGPKAGSILELQIMVGQADCQAVRPPTGGAPLNTTTRNFLLLPARHEWGEGRGEGHSIKAPSLPSPPSCGAGVHQLPPGSGGIQMHPV